jgi:hypothetical protein
MLTERDKANVKAVNTMMELARATIRPSTRDAIWLDVAIHLARLRDIEGRSGAEWESIVREGCGLAKSRAYQIMSLTRKKSPKESRGVLEKTQQYQTKGETR